MRAITVRQPWAWAIVHGGKDVENRTRNIAGAYRGPVAIHAAKADADNAPDSLWLQHANHYRATHPLCDPDAIDSERGVIIGVVDLTDVHDDGDCFYASVRRLAAIYRIDPAAFREFPDSGSGGVLGRARMCSTWAQGDHHHLVLANPRPLANPVRVRGRLGLWTLPDDVEAAVRDQVAP